jgi:hypothetical protein
MLLRAGKMGWVARSLALGALLGSFSSWAIISQIAKAKLRLKKGTLELKYYDDQVEIADGSMNVTRDESVGINLLAPLGWLAKRNVVKLSPLDYTYVQAFGDPEDFGLFSLQMICNGSSALMSRWYFQKMNINTGEMSMGAQFRTGSVVMATMVRNELPWLQTGEQVEPDDFCKAGGETSNRLNGMLLKHHVAEDPNGVFNYKFDAKKTLLISWDAAKWYDRVENEAMKLSQEIRDLLKSE